MHKPTPSRWPQSIRLSQQTYITTDVPSIADVPSLPNPHPIDDNYILCDEYNAFTEESYSSLTREYYTGDTEP